MSEQIYMQMTSFVRAPSPLQKKINKMLVQQCMRKTTGVISIVVPTSLAKGFCFLGAVAADVWDCVTICFKQYELYIIIIDPEQHIMLCIHNK